MAGSPGTSDGSTPPPPAAELLPPQVIESGYGPPTTAASTTSTRSTLSEQLNQGYISSQDEEKTLPQYFVSTNTNIESEKENYNDFYEDVLPGYNSIAAQWVI